MSRILIVEDDVEVATMVGDWLRKEQLLVEVVHDGLEALEMTLFGEFDLIILDWELPAVQGPDLCTNIRAAGKSTAILMLTSKTEITDKELAFAAGVDDYMTKPFHPLELSARVRALLRRSVLQAVASEATDFKSLAKTSESTPCRKEAYLPRIDELVGTIIADKYEILSILGQGFMGVVYKGRHRLLNRTVAVKMLLPYLVSNSVSMGRFEREAYASSSLTHPNIVTVHDYGITAEGLPYLVTEFLDGKSLAEILEEEKHLPANRAVPIFIQASAALAHAHRKGIIHRDIKPSNFILSNSKQGEQLKLIDFGIVKILLPEGNDAQVLTHAGEMLGTPLYMSPEQCMGQEIDQRSDIFGLSCVFYHALSGKIAFAGQNALESMYLRIQEAPLPFKESCPDLEISEDLEEIVLKGLAKRPEDRYNSMEELRQALLQLCQDKRSIV